MANISAKDVAALRAKTGCGMMDCKKALEQANGDMEEAIKVLRERGLAVAAKKAERIAAEGLVDIMVDGNTAAIIEVNSETDFVAKNASFQEFVQGILRTIIKERPADVAALMQLKYDGTDATVEATLKDKIFTIGENMNIRRFQIVDGTFSTYIHGKGQTGVIVAFDADESVKDKPEFAEFAKNIALQIAAGSPPSYVSKEDVPASVVEEEKKILIAQIKNDPANAKKPDSIIEKMVIGRINKLYQQICLLEQEYVKDDSLTVGKYVEQTAKELGGNISVKSFVIYEKGEGLQKREDNFAEEIAKMVGNN